MDRILLIKLPENMKRRIAANAAKDLRIANFCFTARQRIALCKVVVTNTERLSHLAILLKKLILVRIGLAVFPSNMKFPMFHIQYTYIMLLVRFCL